MRDPVVTVMLSLLLMTMAAAVFSATSNHPGRALVVWLAVAGLVPYWVGPSIGAFIPAISLVTILLFMAVARRQRQQFVALDFGVLGLGAICAFAAIVGYSEVSGAAVIIIQWLLAYFLGRHLGHADATFTSRAFGLFGVVIASFALVEFAANWHPFTQMVFDNRAFLIWSPIQYRGGVPRSEWIAGHSIALGCILAATIPFVSTARWRPAATWFSLLVVFGGIAVTFSRSALVSAVFAVVASEVLLGRGRGASHRAAGIAAVAVAGAGSVIVLGNVYSTAQVELSASTSIRFEMLSLIGTLKPLGAAGNAVETVDGRVGFESGSSVYRTLDNAFLYFGLQFGWIAAALFVLVAGALLRPLFSRSVGAAAVATGSQVPVLFSVALITQYASLFWLVAGISVTHFVVSRQEVRNDALTDELDLSGRGGRVPR